MIPVRGDVYLAFDKLKVVKHTSETTFYTQTIRLDPMDSSHWLAYEDYTLYLDVPEHWQPVRKGPTWGEHITLLVAEYLK